MIGALVGDVVGSRFEFQNFKSKDFRLFTPRCHLTDDSLMTLAVAKALVRTRSPEELSDLSAKNMHAIAKKHPNVGWGGRFYAWVFEYDLTPCNSFGNGAGMRVNPVGWVADSEEEVKALSHAVTHFTHGHPEGLLGAESVAMAVYLARQGASRSELFDRMCRDYYPSIATFTLDSIRPTYEIDDKGEWVTCRGSIPQAMRAFFESTSFEDAIRNAISIGGDADTIACMTGAVAEAFYGVPEHIEEELIGFIPEDLLSTYYSFGTVRRPRAAHR